MTGSRTYAALPIATLLLISGCSSVGPFAPEDGAPAGDIDVAAIPDAVPRIEPRSRSGNPPNYVVNGRRYHLLDTAVGYRERGIASWYGTKFHGRRTSSGEPYDMYAMTAAHKSLPLPAYVRVTNLQNRRTTIVRVNDRGPFHPNRIIDLSYAAAKKLGIAANGTGLVEVEAITPGHPPAAPLQVTPAAPTASASTGTRPGLYLQVGAFVSRHNAERLQMRLAQSNLGRVYIQPTNAGDQAVYRVRLGPIGNVERADQLAETLTGLGYGEPHIVVE